MKLGSKKGMGLVASCGQDGYQAQSEQHSIEIQHNNIQIDNHANQYSRIIVMALKLMSRITFTKFWSWYNFCISNILLTVLSDILYSLVIE